MSTQEKREKSWHEVERIMHMFRPFVTEAQFIHVQEQFDMWRSLEAQARRRRLSRERRAQPSHS